MTNHCQLPTNAERLEIDNGPFTAIFASQIKIVLSSKDVFLEEQSKKEESLTLVKKIQKFLPQIEERIKTLDETMRK